MTKKPTSMRASTSALSLQEQRRMHALSEAIRLGCGNSEITVKAAEAFETYLSGKTK